MSQFLLTVVVLLLAYRFVRDSTAESREAARDTQKIQARRDAVHRSPQSPASHESLGDALRDAGRYRDTLIAYENAERHGAAGEASGSGLVGGGGLAGKIRLVRLDARQDAERPASHVAQAARRESVCRQCSTVNAPDAMHCAACGLDLPTNSFLETWLRDDIRRPILREARDGAMISAVLLLALYLASWMPIEVKGVLLISTVAVLVFKGLRSITDK